MSKSNPSISPLLSVSRVTPARVALGARVVGPGLALKIVDTFLDTPFSNGERHIRRIEMIED